MYNDIGVAMSILGSCVFTGSSGSRYQFTSYTTDHEFEDTSAVYILSKSRIENKKRFHSVMYIGESSELSTRLSHHQHLDESINSILVMYIPSKTDRLRVERDLIEHYNPPRNVEYTQRV